MFLRTRKPVSREKRIVPKVSPHRPNSPDLPTPSPGSNKELKEKPAFPAQGEISRMKTHVSTTLERLDAAVLSGPDASDETTISIYIHFSDLCRTTNALYSLLNRSLLGISEASTRDENIIPFDFSDHPAQIQVEYSRGSSHPLSPINGSLVETSSSAYSDEEPVGERRIAVYSPASDIRPDSTSPTATNLKVAPLRIPLRSSSLTSSSNINRLSAPEPFEQEIQELSTRIEESSQMGLRLHQIREFHLREGNSIQEL